MLKKSVYPILEAILFSSSEPVPVEQLHKTLEELPENEIPGAVEFLNKEYEKEGRAFRIAEVAGGYCMETLPQYSPYLERFFRGRIPPKLTRASLETLSIVAYRQPITRAELDAIRGIQSDGTIHTLLERGLIEVTGRAQTLGRPLLYGTTEKFLRYFGLKNLSEMPEPEDIREFFEGWESQRRRTEKATERINRTPPEE